MTAIQQVVLDIFHKAFSFKDFEKSMILCSTCPIFNKYLSPIQFNRLDIFHTWEKHDNVHDWTHVTEMTTTQTSCAHEKSHDE